MGVLMTTVWAHDLLAGANGNWGLQAVVRTSRQETWLLGGSFSILRSNHALYDSRKVLCQQRVSLVPPWRALAMQGIINQLDSTDSPHRSGRAR